MAVEAIKGAAASYTQPTTQTSHASVQEHAETAAKQEIEITPIQVQKPAQTDKDGGKSGDDEQQKKQFSEKAIKSAVENANSTMRKSRTNCEFAYHEKSKRISIKIYDAESDEVIKEIPSEDALKMLEKLWELTGLMLDEKR